MTSAVGFTGTSVSALYQILAEKDQPDGYVGLDASGKIPVQYLPDSIPTDFTNVELKTNKNQPNGYPGLDAGGQLAASVIPPGSYILSSDKGAVNGVAPLDGTGTIYFTDLPVGTTSTSVAAGNHTHTGEFVREDQRNLPNGFAGLGATSKIAIAQIPTGTTSTTVAVGNHAHVGQFEPIINPKRTAFNKDFGGNAGQVSEGNHKHDGGDITTGRIPFERLPTGTVSNTVAIGDHTHTGLTEQQGPFTPTFFYVTPANWSVALPRTDGHFYRLSSGVNFNISLGIQVTSGSGDSLRIGGLPVSSESTSSPIFYPVLLTGYDLSSTPTAFWALLNPGTSFIILYSQNLTTGVRTEITDLSIFPSAFSLYVSGTYYV